MDETLMFKEDEAPAYRTQHPIECKHGHDKSVCVYGSTDSEDYVIFVTEFDYDTQSDKQSWYVTSDYSDVERMMK